MTKLVKHLLISKIISTKWGNDSCVRCPKWLCIANGSLSAKRQGIDRNKLAGEVVRFVVGLKLPTGL